MRDMDNSDSGRAGDEAAGRGGEQDGPPQHVELQIPMAGAMAVAAKVNIGCRWLKDDGVSTMDFVLLTFWHASALGWLGWRISGAGRQAKLSKSLAQLAAEQCLVPAARGRWRKRQQIVRRRGPGRIGRG